MPYELSIASATRPCSRLSDTFTRCLNMQRALPYHRCRGWLRRWGQCMVETTEGRVAGLTFNRSVSLGNLLVILTMIGGAISLYIAHKEVIVSHELRIKYLELHTQNQLNTISTMTTTVFSIQRDIAVIKDRLEREQRTGK